MAASIGELASINPVVGAQYRWTALYAPKVLRPEFWGLMQGTLATIILYLFSPVNFCANELNSRVAHGETKFLHPMRRVVHVADSN